jgi:hypothetical protein
VKERGLTEEVAALKDDEPDVWQRQPNRVMRRNAMFMRGEIKMARSRIRRRLVKLSYKKGAWK